MTLLTTAKVSKSARAFLAAVSVAPDSGRTQTC